MQLTMCGTQMSEYVQDNAWLRKCCLGLSSHFTKETSVVSVLGRRLAVVLMHRCPYMEVQFSKNREESELHPGVLGPFLPPASLLFFQQKSACLPSACAFVPTPLPWLSPAHSEPKSCDNRHLHRQAWVGGQYKAATAGWLAAADPPSIHSVFPCGSQ